MYTKDSFTVYHDEEKIEGASPMNFNDSVKNVEVNSRGILKAKSKTDKDTIFRKDLNDYLGNNDGFFEIGSKNFSETSENIYVVKNKKLKAELYDRNNNINTDTINLNDILKVKDGKLSFKNLGEGESEDESKSKGEDDNKEISLNCIIL